MQAMILAAGYGTRLQPYSQVQPKPLFPVLNRPLLLATIDRLKNAGFTSITVNCHHLRHHIVHSVKELSGIIVQEEPDILGTGGGLRRALDHLTDEPLLVTNGDIYHTIDYGAIYEHHLRMGTEVTMVLHDCQRFNSVSVVGDRIVSFNRQRQGYDQRAFTGLQVINPGVLASIAPGTSSCIIEHFRTLLKAEKRIGFFMVEEANWTDMGTPRDYLDLHEALLTGTIPAWPELNCRLRGTVLIDSGARCGTDSSFKQWACVGKADIGADTTVKRSVIWDGAVVASRTNLVDCIVPPEPIPGKDQ